MTGAVDSECLPSAAGCRRSLCRGGEAPDSREDHRADPQLRACAAET